MDLQYADASQQTQFITGTVTLYPYSTVTQTSNYGANAVQAKRQIATPRPLNSMNVPLSLLSRACSCYVPPPTRATSTRTITATAVRSVTATKRTVRCHITLTANSILVDLGRSQKLSAGQTTTSFTTRRVRTTVTSLEVVGVQTYVTESGTSTLTITVTSCRGANPTSPFGLRIADTTATRTDSYNNLYATPTPNPVFDGFFTLDLLPAAQGKLFNVDCLGRLVVPAPGGGETLYAAMSPLFLDFGIVYFLSSGDIEKRDYIYLTCAFAGAFLDCRAPQPAPGPDLTMFQTCPLYDEYYETPLVLANYQSTDAPECFGLRLRRV